MSEMFSNNEEVLVDIERMTIRCIVCGYSSDLPVFGRMYIVKTKDGSIISDTYPYSAFTVSQNNIRKIS